MKIYKNSQEAIDLRKKLRRRRGGLAPTARALGYRVAPHHLEMCVQVELHHG